MRCAKKRKLSAYRPAVEGLENRCLLSVFGIGLPVAFPVGQPADAPALLGLFTDTHGTPGDTANYSVEIDWGDGSPADATGGSVVQFGLDPRGLSFQVFGNHQFDEVGLFAVSVTIHDTADNSDDTLTAFAIAGDGFGLLPPDDILPDPGDPIPDPGEGHPPLPPPEDPGGGGELPLPVKILPIPIEGIEGVPFEGILATFVCPELDALPDDFSATIDWGDGQVTVGKVVEDESGLFEVIGEVTFDDSGPLSVQVTITCPSGDVMATTTPADVGHDAVQHFVAEVYEELLERPVDPDGLEFFSGLLDDGVIDRPDLVEIISHCEEYAENVVDDVYHDLLERVPDLAGLGFWGDFIENGGTQLQLEQAILSSPEYFQMHGGLVNDGFLDALYQDVMGRPVDDEGAAFFGDLLELGVPIDAIVSAVAYSPEALTQEVENLYAGILNRPVDEGGLDFCVDLLQNGMPSEVIASFLLASEEFYSHL